MEIENKEQLKLYAETKLKEFNEYYDKFQDIYNSIIQYDQFKQHNRKYREKSDYFKKLIKELNEGNKYYEIESTINVEAKKIESCVNSAKRMFKNSENYYLDAGSYDRERIKEITDEVNKNYSEFKSNWKKNIARAIKNKEWEAAVRALYQIPHISDYISINQGRGQIYYFYEAEQLQKKNEEIISCLEKFKQSIPKDQRLKVRIKMGEEQMVHAYKKMSQLIGKLSKLGDANKRDYNPKSILDEKHRNKIDAIINKIDDYNNAVGKIIRDNKQREYEIKNLPANDKIR